jgi:hypothetical protein
MGRDYREQGLPASETRPKETGCATCRTLAVELADALDDAADLRKRCAALLESLSAWNESAALALRRDAARLERGEVRA